MQFIANHLSGDAEANVEAVDDAIGGLAQRYDDPATTIVWHELATRLHGREKRVEAHRIATRAIESHPTSIGANRCRQLIRNIERREYQIQTDSVWHRGGGQYTLNYRNLTRLHFWVVRNPDANVDPTSRGSTPWTRTDWSVERLAALPVVKKWSQPLAATDDYQTASTTGRVENFDGLPKGSYWLVVSDRDSIDDSADVTAMSVQRTDLAFAIPTQYRMAKLNFGWVTDEIGLPVAGARVTIHRRESRGNWVPSVAQVTTDDGRFQLPDSDRSRIVVDVTKGDDRVRSSDDVRIYNRGPQENVQTRSVFYTDRAIYRPGQTVRFKTIAFSSDPANDRYQAMANQTIGVTLSDANRQAIETVQLRTNRFGSAHGSFVLPDSGLTGRFTIAMADGPPGRTQISVEEYKRPRFEVTTDAPEDVRIGQAIRLKGRAIDYTGFAVPDALVRYRIVRNSSYPRWCWWLGDDSVAISDGEVRTDTDGNFVVPFEATIPSADRDAEPDSPQYAKRYRYTVSIDVTDAAGETRSTTTSVAAARHRWALTLSDQTRPFDQRIAVRVAAQTINGVAVQTEVRAELIRLIAPENVPGYDREGRVRIEIPTPRIESGDEPGNKPPVTDAPRTWPAGPTVATRTVTTDASGNADVVFESINDDLLHYRVVVTAVDPDDNEVRDETSGSRLNLESNRGSIKSAQDVFVETDSVEVGQAVRCIWASGFERARALIIVMSRNRVRQTFWTDPNRTQQSFTVKVDESMRGGVSITAVMYRAGRFIPSTRNVAVPWTNKKLDLKITRLDSRLTPGEQQIVEIKVDSPIRDNVDAEAVATMYDASLDVFRRLSWGSPASFPGGYSYLRIRGSIDGSRRLRFSGVTVDLDDVGKTAIELPTLRWPMNLTGGRYPSRVMGRRGMAAAGAVPAMMFAEADQSISLGISAKADLRGGVDMYYTVGPIAADAPGEPDAYFGFAADDASPPAPEFDPNQLRTDLSETAFFDPAVITDDQGRLTFRFTVPDSLTKWRIVAMAHDAQLASGLVDATTQTAKDLMVRPARPRFLRTGDRIEFSLTINNASNTRQTGQAVVSFQDAVSGDDVTGVMCGDATASFDMPAGGSQTVRFEVNVPEGLSLVSYKAVATSGVVGDGEEDYLPVLPRRVAVDESIAIAIRGDGSTTAVLDPLANLNADDDVRHQSLELQVVSNPAWYAAMSLPYLMEFPHECSEQMASRLYANAIGRHIMKNNPRLARVLEVWRREDRLHSPLALNESLQSTALNETPFLKDAIDQRDSMRRLSEFLEPRRLNDEIDSITRRLSERQNDDGSFAWFPGGRPSPFITTYVAVSLGRLTRMGVEDPSGTWTTIRDSAIDYLDGEARRRYLRIKPDDRDENHLSGWVADYLYARSVAGRGGSDDEGITFWIRQSTRYWTKLDSRDAQAKIALAAVSQNDRRTADAIIESLRQRAVVDAQGMYWRGRLFGRDTTRTPVETAATMIEVFDAVAGDRDAVNELKVWLIGQKRTHHWPTTKATADAVYALLMRDANVLDNNDLVRAKLGGTLIQPDDVVAGLGAYSHRVDADDVTSKLGRVELTKTDDGVSFASLHWRSLRPIDSIPRSSGGENDVDSLSIERKLFVKRYVDGNAELTTIDDDHPPRVGDEVVHRLIVSTDRELEFVRITDLRPSGTEPVDVLSGYRRFGGAYAYQSTRDTATHFFADVLPRGTHVIEYSTRVQFAGTYATGFAEAVCMYAPEFAAHSASNTMQAKRSEK